MNALDHRLQQKLKLVLVVFYAAALIIIATLWYLQIYQGEFFFERSTKNFLRHEPIDSLRGTIFDRHNVPLATNRPVTNLVWHATGAKKLSEEQHAIINQLSDILGLPRESLIDLTVLEKHERSGQDCLLYKDLQFKDLSIISEHLAQHKNIVLKTDVARFYPHGHYASHALGYFRNTHNQTEGKMGLERLFEEQLRGEPGTREKMINSTGHNLHSREIQKALSGENIMTTLDFGLQKIAEDLFSPEQTGALIIINPKSGDILVTVSRPTFDPNMFLRPVSGEEWQHLQEQQPFINRGLNACYPPASLFKLITATAGLEEKLITPETLWTCTGHITFGSQNYHCNRRYRGHGEVNIEDALANSCNIPFYEIAKNLHIDTIARYAEKLGLGQKTGTILPEKDGLIPSAEWKMETFGERWWPGETLAAAIGQTYLLVTPLQIARTIGGICTGQFVKPRILLNEPIETTPITISQGTRQFLINAMHETVLRGTAKKLSALANMEIYAKTGTAQTSHHSKRKFGKKYLEHAWFAAHAQYKNHEPFVIVILLEHARTAQVATTMAKKFFQQYCDYCDKHA